MPGNPGTILFHHTAKYHLPIAPFMQEKALELRNVSVIRDGVKVLSSVDLVISKGENVAVIGANGSGKTTLIKLLRGEIRPYFDQNDPPVMRIFGNDKWDLFDIRRHMGVVSMDLQSMFDESTTVSDVICSGFFSSIDVFRGMTVTDDMKSKAASAAYIMGIEELLTRRIGCLSLGEMRRALIARALVSDPEILVLDEPMTGLDIVMKSKFRKMFDILIRSGVSIVMITHDLSDIPSSVDRVIAMKDGHILMDGTKESVLTDSNVSEVFGESIKVIQDKGSYSMHLVEEGEN